MQENTTLSGGKFYAVLSAVICGYIKLYLNYTTPRYKRATSTPITKASKSTSSASGGTLDNKNFATAYPRMNNNNATKMFISLITSFI